MSVADLVPAGRSRRFVAASIDKLLLLTCAAVPGVWWALTGRAVWQDPGLEQRILLAGAGAALPWVLIQAALLDRTGASIGKLLLGLRVVRPDGRRADFLHAVVLRSWLPGALCLPATCLFLADWICVFRPDRRAVHDLFADTLVVRVDALSEPGARGSHQQLSSPQRDS